MYCPGLYLKTFQEFIKANLNNIVKCDSLVAQELNILGTAVHAMTTKICNMYIVQCPYVAGNCKVDVKLTLQVVMCGTMFEVRCSIVKKPKISCSSLISK